MRDADEVRAQRGTFVTVLLTLMATGAAVALMVAACGGMLVYALAVVGGVAAVGLFHYLLWGRAFSQEVAWEREEAETEDEGVGAADGEPPWPDRF